MSAVIQIDLKDNSKDWSSTIKQQFAAAGVDAKKLDSVLSNVNAALDPSSASEFTDRLKQHFATAGIEANRLDSAIADVNAELQSRAAADYSAKIKRIADDMTGLTTRTQAAAKSQSVFWTETMSKFNLAKEAFSWVSFGARQFGTFAQKMADDGDASFKRLINAGDKFQGVMDELANSREVRDMINDMAAAAEDLLPVIRELGSETISWFRYTQDGIKYSMEGYIRLAEAIGLVQQGMTQAYREEGAAREAESKKRQAEAEKRIAESKARQAAAQAAREQEMINPGLEMSKNAILAEYVAKLRDTAVINREINSLVAVQTALAAKLKAEGKDPTTDRTFVDNAKELVALEQRRLDLQKEERERKAKFVEDQAASEKKVRDDQIKGLDDLLAQEKAGSKEAMDLERRKADLIKKNKEEEKRLLKEKGLLEDKLARDDLARIEERAKKEREAVLAGIEGERMLFLARERRRQAEMEAEQEKVNKLKELLQGQGGGGQGGMGGGGAQGPDFAGRLAGGIKPRDVQRQVMRKREEEALRQWREEQRAAGRMDQNNQLIDPDELNQMGDGPEGFNGRAQEGEIDRNAQRRRQAARTKGQERAVRQRARRQAFRDMRQGNVGNAELADAGGELLQQAGENLIGNNNLNQTQVNAIRQTVQEIRNNNQQIAALQDQLNQIMRELAAMRGGNNNGNRNQRRGN